MTTEQSPATQRASSEDPNVVQAEPDAITLSEFCRREGNDAEIQDLADSIERTGLIHYPVAVEQDDGTYLLLAGRRRYLACLKLGWEEVIT